MLRLILRRLLISIPLLVGISIVSFLIINLAPGGQVALPGEELNPSLTPETRAEIARQFHFDKALHIQYYLMMKDLFTGELRSFKGGRSATAMVLERVPATLALSGMSIFISFSAAIPLGIYAARHKGRWPDRTVSILSFALIALPSFWVAYMLISLLSYQLNLPVLGTETFAASYDHGWQIALDRAWHVFLPAVTLSLAGIAGQSRYMRASMVESMNEDYIRTARAKGLSEGVVAYKHALRNSLRPIVTLLGYMLPALLGGSVIIEQIFAYPGMGRLTYQAMLDRDVPVLMVSLMIGSGLLLLGNLIADILYGVVDPRVRAS